MYVLKKRLLQIKLKDLYPKGKNIKYASLKIHLWIKTSFKKLEYSI